VADLKFGDYVFDTRRLSVTGPTGIVPLRPRAREVLFYLIANRNRFVPRDELAQAIWHEKATSAATINQTVSEVRRALGDSPEAAAYIETRSKAGYRFVASVVHLPTATVDAQRPPGSTADPRPTARPRRLAMAVGSGALLLGALMIFVIQQRGTPILVVSRPVAEDGMESTRALASALRGEVEAALAVLPGRVVFPGTPGDASEGLVLTMNCRTVHGLRVEVTATLLQAGDSKEVWRGTWMGPPDEDAIATLAREVAAASAKAAGEHLISP
jgi:DNA-binding winged helix-turn-helix (wHTH) protein